MAETSKESGWQEGGEYRNLAFHPYNVLLVLLLFGISALFLAFSAAFIYNRVQQHLPPVQLPAIFLLNTIALLGSSSTLIWARRAYHDDQADRYQAALLATLVLSVIFLTGQFIGWRALFQSSVFIDSGNAASYLYVVSGLHFAHVLGGLPFLAAFLLEARRLLKEPVSALVYFSDPEKRLRLRLLTLYWHFIDGLWIYLALFFLINQFIR